MPKVSDDYIKKKKEAICQAAFRVFQKKPLYELTMLDVITEAGLSRGGIYKYFDNVDQVIVAMVNQVTAQNKLSGKIDQILETAKNSKEAIKEMLLFLGRYIQEHVATVGKIQFELTVMVANHPEKSVSIVEKLTEQEAGQYIIQSLFLQMKEGIEAGELSPILPFEDIVDYVGTYIDGLLHKVVLIRCYQAGTIAIDEEKSMKLLVRTVFFMLGVEEEKSIKKES